MHSENDLIAKPQLAASLGVSGRTLSRWMGDESVEFPKSLIICNRHFFRRADVEAWKAEQLRKSMSMRASFRANAAEAAA